MAHVNFPAARLHYHDHLWFGRGGIRRIPQRISGLRRILDLALVITAEAKTFGTTIGSVEVRGYADASDMRRPHALTVPFVGSPLLPAFRGAVCGRAFRSVVLTHVFASYSPDAFGYLINDNVLKSAPDCNCTLICWTNHLFLSPARRLAIRGGRTSYYARPGRKWLLS